MPNSSAHPLLWSDEEGHNIPNGRFKVRDDHSGLEFHYQIYTVQNGSLINQRIIKCKVGGAFKGFGFIMSDGSMKLWRSHRSDEGTGYVNVAKSLVRVLADSSQTRSWSDHADSYSFTVQHSCIRCNDSLGGIWLHFCNQHRDAIADLRRSIEQDERVVRYDAMRARRVVSSVDRDTDYISYASETIDIPDDEDGDEDPSQAILDDSVPVRMVDVPRVTQQARPSYSPPRRDLLGNVVPTAAATLDSVEQRRLARRPTTNELLSENGTGLIR